MNQPQVDWQKMGNLIPCVVQDNSTQNVLMLGYMNPEAYQKTQETGFVTFYSRSRNKLWQKGETSGHKLEVRSLHLDCDNDALLAKVDPVGPTCHKGVTSCFTENELSGLSFLGALDKLIEQRYESQPEGSYTTKLFQEGIHRMAQKVGEEGVEVALAAKDQDTEELLGESADLIFHLMVLLRGKGHSLQDALAVLQQRRQESR